MAKYEEEFEGDYEEKSVKHKAKYSDAKFSGAKSMASSILWISLVIFILNLGLLISGIVLQNKWWDIVISIDGHKIDTGISLPPYGYLIAQPVVGGVSLFLLSGVSILVLPLNKTLKKEQARTFGTWFWGLIIWIFSVFYVGMFFFNIIAPVINLMVAVGVLDKSWKLNNSAINICNFVMQVIPFVTFIAGGILYGRVKATYRKRHGQ